MAILNIKTSESNGPGGNNGDSYWNGTNTLYLLSQSGIPWVEQTTTGDRSAAYTLQEFSGGTGGAGGTTTSTTGGTGANGEAIIIWPMKYQRKSNGTIEYEVASGDLPRSGTIRFSDLAQLGRDADGVRLSSYYRGSQFAPSAGQYSGSFPYTSASGQKNLGSYRISVDASTGFHNRITYSTASYLNGTSYLLNIPRGVRYFWANLKGAGGGGGGSDQGIRDAGSGSNGHLIYGRVDTQLGAINLVKQVSIWVGAGGTGGSFAGGGGAGYSPEKNWKDNNPFATSGPFHGAAGGPSGTTGQSGGGGAGGGATFMYVGASIYSSHYIAGGGGGGGGSGFWTYNPYQNGGSHNRGVLRTTTHAGYQGQLRGVGYSELGYLEGTVIYNDGGGAGGGGGGALNGGISGGRQGSATYVLTTWDDTPQESGGGGGY